VKDKISQSKRLHFYRYKKAICHQSIHSVKESGSEW